MTWLLVIEMLKKGWGYVDKALSLLWKYKTIVVVSLLILLTSHLHKVNQDLIGKNIQITNKFETYKKDQKVALLEAQKQAKDKEIEILTKQKEVEVKYNEQVKKLQSDLTNANSTNNSLLNTLSTIKSRVSTATDSEVRAYSETATELLGKCETGKLYYAQRADEHAYAEERAVSLYNAMVDSNVEVK